jgi:hypothetical protein
MRKSKPQIEGMTFGRLCVESVTFEADAARHRWVALCRCQCGSVVSVSPSNLRSGNSQSCGCLHRERASKRMRDMRTTHGEGYSKLYHVWRMMHRRCEDERQPNYHRYGGRGIAVCQEWETYEAFRDWARSSGYGEGLTLERVNNDLGYSPENCAWVNRKAQALNTRRNRYVTALGETKILSDWVRDSRCIVDHSTLINRLDSGWPPDLAIAGGRHAWRGKRS